MNDDIKQALQTARERVRQAAQEWGAYFQHPKPFITRTFDELERDFYAALDANDALVAAVAVFRYFDVVRSQGSTAWWAAKERVDRLIAAMREEGA